MYSLRPKTSPTHRLILHPPKGKQVDHRNHKPLDCRRSEMRICTCSENMQNQVQQKGRSSQFKGVSWHKANANWTAQIKHNGKQIHLGCFAIEEEAARGYDAKAIELFGEFALLNFPRKQLKYAV